MLSEMTTEARRRGRPRSERSRRAILHAASDLLLERGLSEISMDAVADRAEASKATIYRWWPSKELLVLDALLSEWGAGAPDAVDTGSLGDRCNVASIGGVSGCPRDAGALTGRKGKPA